MSFICEDVGSRAKAVGKDEICGGGGAGADSPVGGEALLCKLRGGYDDDRARSKVQGDDRPKMAGKLTQGLVERFGEEVKVAEDGKGGRGWGEDHIHSVVLPPPEDSGE